jgi:hypothetical protein
LLLKMIRSGDISGEQMHFRWVGPERVEQAITTKGRYILKELSSVELVEAMTRNCLKRFYSG